MQSVRRVRGGMLDEALKRVAVVGAGGKMGRGISALLLQEIAALEASQKGSVGSGEYILTLIDSDEKSFISLKQYLHEQILKYAEKNIVQLRTQYANDPHLVSNEEIIQSFVDGSLSLFSIESELESVKDANLIFEAIIEDPQAKIDTLSRLQKNNPNAIFLTNTSSIPISYLAEKAGLNQKIIGYHFYNPPVVQQLLEVVIPEKTPESIIQMSKDLAKRLKKQIVYSKDVAGFIGNGHFIRELSYAGKLAKELGAVHTYAEAVYLINRVTQEYLLRPMGIFQLADYVGLDVCASIMKIMNEHDDLIEWMIGSGSKGGQDAHGHQKPGFFQYKGNVPSAVYSLETKAYLPLEEKKMDSLLGFKPANSWKKLQNDPEKDKKIAQHFEILLSSPDLGAEIARNFLHHSKEVAYRLVKEGVAEKIEDVNAVLQNGFYHMYGADYGSI